MIKLEHLCKDFVSNNPLLPVNKVLKDINLTINDGDFISVIGSNGSGKSTLLNTISGSYLPTSGKIYFDDTDVTQLKDFKRAKYIGRVFQDPNVGTIGDISIEENLALAFKRGERRGLSWALKEEYEKVYARHLTPLNLGIENRLHEKISTLSGGQRQSITLLMSILKKPKLLLLDEHTAALDPKTSKKIMELTKDLVEENKLTTLMITHNMRDALKYGNRLIMLSNGRIIADFSSSEKNRLTIEDLYDRFDKAEEDTSFATNIN
ncbi:MAG: ATP-binding cassette domain-containing protein [Bacilli bacterium]